jgi:GR25 family glycosyltransferase involved in LPS biosynthesis
MNLLSMDDLRAKAGHHLRSVLRHADLVRRVNAFSSQETENSIGRIYVINLDRKQMRWSRTRRELQRFRDRAGRPLTEITRRFSAVDARYLEGSPDPKILRTNFTLAEQLSVNPDPLLQIDAKARANRISMTRPEIAIALSHIAAWRLIAAGDVERVLVLEDDIMMRPRFATKLNREWPALVDAEAELIYFAYHDVSEDRQSSKPVTQRRLTPGLWEASSYVLSRSGAQKLLSALPANGPIDLWLNFQFSKIRTFSTAMPIAEQRLLEPSTNSYSVLPVLSQVGAVAREKPLISRAKKLPGPIIVTGPPNSGLTSIATALSMLGYTVMSDLATISEPTIGELRRSGRCGNFNAFVNIGGIEGETLNALARNKHARFIATDPAEAHTQQSDRQLYLPQDTKDEWSVLTEFLGVDYPSFDYPNEQELGQRKLADSAEHPAATHRNLRWDRSPWIVERSKTESIHPTILEAASPPHPVVASWSSNRALEGDVWRVRDDTFPSNLALFRPENFVQGDTAQLILNSDSTIVREYSSAAIASRKSFLYGSFQASLRPARGSGMISGMFLHRNGPRQEIDIEFRGKDTSKMLINVFYNPGPKGTKLEFGYRGTPTEIDLGFDAANGFHDYEIEWRPGAIRWKVDNVVVYQRQLWGPTPIPDRPLEFNINLWTSRSREFAGQLDKSALPATTMFSRIEITD